MIFVFPFIQWTPRVKRKQNKNVIYLKYSWIGNEVFNSAVINGTKLLREKGIGTNKQQEDSFAICFIWR